MANRAVERARALRQAGRVAEAIDAYRQILARKPRELNAMLGLAQLMEQTGDLRECVRLLEAAIAAGADGVPQRLNLSLLQGKLGKMRESREAAEWVLARDSANMRAHCLVAIAEERLNRVDEAIAAAERALALQPDHEEASLVVARMLRRRGDLDGARTRLESLLAPPAPVGTRAAAVHELGTVLDRLGEYDAAYGTFARAGAEDAATAEYGRVEHGLASRRIAAYLAGLSATLLAKWGRARYDDGLPTPRFLVGFPRSGTTMTEQILAAHPALETSDEQPLLLAVVDAIIAMTGRSDDLTAGLRTMSSDDVRRLRSVYWTQAERLGHAVGGRILVDKNPLNLIDLGLINVLFPDARVIVALRDPRDACLSCFMQSFRMNPAMANFVTLEGACVFYEEVMDQWLAQRDLLTIDTMTIRYEDTVRDLPGEARRLLEFVGVPWDDGVLRFHEKAKDRLVATPSYEAVTETVHTRAIGRWRNYASPFEPHLGRLERFVEAFGYAEEDAGD